MTAIVGSAAATTYRHGADFEAFDDDRLLSRSSAVTGRRDRLSVAFPVGVAYPQRLLLEAVVAALNDLRDLPADWDGDAAEQITDTAALTGFAVVAAIIDADSIPPHVVPLASGGLQLEWLVAGHDLEVEIGPDGDIYALGSDADGTIVLDSGVSALAGDASSDSLRDYLRRLTLPLIGSR